MDKPSPAALQVLVLFLLLHRQSWTQLTDPLLHCHQQAIFSSSVADIREFWETTTAIATTESPNKTFNEGNNSCARAFWIFVHFFAVFLVFFKTTTWNDRVVRVWESVCHNGYFFVFSFGTERCHYIFRLSKIFGLTGELNRSTQLWYSRVKYNTVLASFVF